MDFLNKADLLADMLDTVRTEGQTKKAVATANQIQVALNAFMAEPSRITKKIQATTGFGVSTDFDRVAKDSFSVFQQAANFDLGWEKAFKVVPVGKNQDSWEIHDVANGLTFRAVNEGERIEVYGMSGSKATVYVSKYGGALGWTDEMIRFRKIAAIADKAEMFRNKFWANKADVYYTLIASGAPSGGTNTTTYQGAGTDTVLSRDIATINEGAYVLGERLKNSGYGDTANSPLVLFINKKLESRIDRAMIATKNPVIIPGLSKNGAVLDKIYYNIEIVTTFNSAIPLNAGILVLPQFKNQRADVMQPTSYTQQDILSMTNIQAVWAYHGGAIGDTSQLQRINFA